MFQLVLNKLMNKLFFASIVTLSILASFVFFLVIIVLLFFDTINLGLAIGLTVVINFVMWLVGPWFTDWINKFFYKTTFLTKDQVQSQHPEVAAIIHQACIDYNFPFPKVGIIADKNPTAFTYGSGRYNARIVLTEGIFEYLSPQEVQAVVAHEIGHIVNRDFIVMMIASTLLQIIYEIYAVLIRARGKKSGGFKLVALVAYAMYWIGTYLLYYLSRTRETMADEFSAKRTSPQDLANALIKIAYGIVAASDDDRSTRLLQSTRHLGIVDVKNAKQVGVSSYISHNDPNVLAEVMVFDRVSWWARWLELNATHPLTGKRITRLSKLSKTLGTPFSFDVDGAIARMNINYAKLKHDFIIGFLISSAPYITMGAFLFFAPLEWFPVGVFLGFLIAVVYKFPQEKAVPTTVLEQMRDPYASPVRGKVIQLQGKVVGRGIPGYVFSEDMMYQDKTGLTFLDYNSAFGFLGDFFFALKKIKKVFEVPSTVEGWYFRGLGSMVALKYIKTEQETVRSHPMLWALLTPTLIIGAYFYLRYIFL